MGQIKSTYIAPIVIVGMVIIVFYSIGVIFTIQVAHNYRVLNHMDAFKQASGSVRNHYSNASQRVRQSIRRRDNGHSPELHQLNPK